MALSERSLVVGVFADRSQAEQSIEQLRRAGFGDDEVGFAMRGEEPAEEVAETGPAAGNSSEEPNPPSEQG